MSFDFSIDKDLAGSGDCENDPFVMSFDSYVYSGDMDKIGDKVSAIYFFYSIRMKNGKEFGHMLYIGKAEDLKKRISQHEVRPSTVPKMGPVTIDKLGDYLCDLEDVTRKCYYTYAEVDGRRLERFEAAAIKVFQPVINIKNKKSFGCHKESWFKCTGKYAYAKDEIQHAIPDKQ